MCGRYTLVPDNKFYDRFEVGTGAGRDPLRSEISLRLQPRYNIAPGQNLPVITRNSPNRIELMKWGLIPFWARDPKIGYRTINAKAETVATKPAFSNSFRNKRCLIPASGFYEWKRVGQKKKQPFYFYLRDGSMFSFAGLYDIWKSEQGEEIKTYTIITTEANELVKDVHDRMPVILPKEDEDTWLDKATDIETLVKLLKPYPASEMALHPISTLVNDAKLDEERLINSL